MDLVDKHGLSLAIVSPEDLDARPWTAVDRPVDVVRVLGSPVATWPDLAERGFVPKPAALTWVAGLGADEYEFLSRLDTKTRQDVRRAQRRATAAGLHQVVEAPLTAESLDRFLLLYGRRVADMRYGVAFAQRHRDAILDSGRYFGVFALDDDRMVGGALVLECPDEDAIRIRFSAVAEEWRRPSLARVLYFTAMREARTRGYAWGTLGDEPNLYGHLTQPGLLAFKADLGFRAVPVQDFGNRAGTDEADLILRLAVLNDPSIVLGYADVGDGADRHLSAHVFADRDIDPRRYAAPFLRTITVRRPWAATGGGC